MVNKKDNFKHIVGLKKYLKLINFDEERYEVVKAREEIYGSKKNPCYLCDVTYKNKIPEDLPTPTELLREFRELSVNFAPTVYTRPPKNTNEVNKLVEVCLFDHHFGQLSWKPEVGENYDIKIAKKLAIDAIKDIISQLPDDVDRFLLPIGNDFFNVNSSLNTTMKGIPQAEDCRYQKTFTEGARLVTTIIDMLASIAPVDVIIITGNHDEERSFYLGEYLFSWYRLCDFVNIDNAPMKRKWYQFGKVGLGFTHGNNRDMSRLPILMAQEAPKMWASTKFREVHVGHLHKEKGMFYTIDDKDSVIIRFMPSLSSIDDWHFKHGYNHVKKSIAILWDSEKGQRAEYVYTI